MIDLATLDVNDGVAVLRLNRPDRHNSLVPDLMQAVRTSISDARRADPTALVLTGNGKSFSTGGDIGGFLANAETDEALLAYADDLVGELHEAVLDLLSFPGPVLAAVNGPVTGGSAGFVLASDLVAMADHAFLQPYYGEVGFGPDGGWTALLPERIGTSKALEIQYLNERITADQAVRLGLATCAVPAAELDEKVISWISTIKTKKASSLIATRAGIWDDLRLGLVRQRLDAEKRRFLENITMSSTRSGMAAFVSR
jgi:2-(1,2-epoxy-1,2-dihydrophenyl)acetyl-CoA isomerase